MESKLTITLGADGQLRLGVTGPAASSKLLLLGMLEMTKGMIMAPPAEAKPGPALLVANGALPTGR